MSDVKNVIPVIEGLYSGPADSPRFIAGKCKNCNTVYFPISPETHSPECTSPDVEQIFLSRKGRIVSYTIHHYPPPPPFRMEPFKPFAIGVVELPEKIQIIGMLTGVPFDEIQVNLEVELVTGRLYDDEDGNEVQTWMWKPI